MTVIVMNMSHLVTIYRLSEWFLSINKASLWRQTEKFTIIRTDYRRYAYSVPLASTAKRVYRNNDVPSTYSQNGLPCGSDTRPAL